MSLIQAKLQKSIDLAMDAFLAMPNVKAERNDYLINLELDDGSKGSVIFKEQHASGMSFSFRGNGKIGASITADKSYKSKSLPQRKDGSHNYDAIIKFLREQGEIVRKRENKRDLTLSARKKIEATGRGTGNLQAPHGGAHAKILILPEKLLQLIDTANDETLDLLFGTAKE